MLSDESDQGYDKTMTRMIAHKRKNNICESKLDKTLKKKMMDM